MVFQSERTRRSLTVDGVGYDYFSLPEAEKAGFAGISDLPICVRVVVENVIRRHADGLVEDEDIEALRTWVRDRAGTCEVPFLPSRVMMPESSGMVLLGDMAAMRDAVVALGGTASQINPVLPVDFIVDHSVNAHRWGSAEALGFNMREEMRENRERFEFLRWASDAFDGLTVYPPGSGIQHQINLEHLARVVWTTTQDGRQVASPDSLIAMDSHTAMINAIGVIGWGVGGFEGGNVALGEPVSLLIPETIGVRLVGALRPGVTSTDLVLTITQRLRQENILGRFVEYFGEGVSTLPLTARATVSNMTPEIGATMSYFPVDEQTIAYLGATGREPQQIALVEAYCRAQGLWMDLSRPPRFDHVVNIDLSAVEPSVAGPSRPDARVRLGAVKAAFETAYPDRKQAAAEGAERALQDGDIVIASITSCTNTSNPALLIGAGLLAQKARALGLTRKPWVKATLSPGSRVVADYLQTSGLQAHLDALGFNIAGFGCMTCMGNSGPLPAEIDAAIRARDIAAVAVLSGNRNFDGRIHGSVRASFLASPPLVVAYAIAGSVRLNLEQDPLGHDRDGAPVYLRDIWPSDDQIQDAIARALTPKMFRDRYATIRAGTPEWRELTSPGGQHFRWDADSTFIRRPPFFDNLSRTAPPVADIRGARILGMFGDMLTTDHISPIGTIAPTTPAGRYLAGLGVQPKDFVNYGARRLNHDVMARGTFASTRIRNEMTPDAEGSATIHHPDGQRMSIFDAALRYRSEGVPLVIVAGREYGAGSSRDWAAKGTYLLGVRAVIAESLERIHRSNLVSTGVLPLQFQDGVSRRTLGLDGSEVIDIAGLEGAITPRMKVTCRITRADGRVETIPLVVRLDSKAEVNYWRDGGILNFLIRRRLDERDPGARTMVPA